MYTFNKKFHKYGNVCETCGNSVRYIRGGKCVICKSIWRMGWQKRNREGLAECRRVYRLAHLDQERARDRKKKQERLDRSHPNRRKYAGAYALSLLSDEERAEHKSRLNCNQLARRRARRKGAVCDGYKREDVFAAFPLCLKCGSDTDLTIDHVVPLSLGGDDTVDNVQVLCRTCNSSKGARSCADYRHESHQAIIPPYV